MSHVFIGSRLNGDNQNNKKKTTMLNCKVFLLLAISVLPIFHQETNGETQLRSKSLETACRANKSEQMKMAAPPYGNVHAEPSLARHITKHILNVSTRCSNKALPNQLQEPVQCRPIVRSELRYSCHIEPWSFLIVEK